MRTTTTILAGLALLFAWALPARAEDAATLRDAIDGALAGPEAVRLERHAEDAWAIGGAEPCDPPDPCDSPWSFSFGLGLNLAQGNSDKFDLALDGEAVYDKAPNRFVIGALFAYGESDGLTTTEALHASVRGERDLDERWYAFAQLDYDRDEPADLEYRWTATGGLGVKLIDGPGISLKAEGGGGYIWEKRVGRTSTDDPSLYFGVDYRKEWRSGTVLSANYKFVPNLGDFDLSLMTFQTKLAVPLCAELALTISLRIDHVLDAPPPAENTDLLLAVGLRLTL